MPIFATPRYENNDDVDILHELEATPAGTKPQQDEDEDKGDNPTDAPEDYTLDDEGEDQTPEEGDQNAPEEGTEADNQADDGDDSFGGDDSAGADDQADTGDGDGGGDGGMGDAGQADDGDDSFGGGEEGEDGDGGGEGEGGEDADTDDYTSDSGGGDDEDELKKVENDIFANYSPEQRAIMSKALKKRFNSVMEMSADLVDRINEIPKSMEHIKAIEFVTDKIDEIQRMVADYLYYTFDTKTYTENAMFFEQLMVTYNQLSDLVGKIPSIKVSKPAT